MVQRLKKKLCFVVSVFVLWVAVGHSAVFAQLANTAPINFHRALLYQSKINNRYQNSEGFTYTPDLVACPLPCREKDAATSNWLQDEKFRPLGVKLIPKSIPKSIWTDKLGQINYFGTEQIPVWFDQGGVALMDNTLVVGVKKSPLNLAELKDKTEAELLTPYLPDSPVYLLKCHDPISALDIMNQLANDNNILYIHPNFRLPLELRQSFTPPDPLFPDAWHLTKTGADRAWLKSMGSPTTVIALIDLGFEQTHPDLQTAWYVNDQEIAGNKLDDDQNGLVDDISGWNFVTQSSNLIYGAGPAHGTATAGIIGARSNHIGSLGICPLCRILPIVIDDHVATAISAMRYAEQQSVSVVSNSWGYVIDTPSMEGLKIAIHHLWQFGRQGRGTSIVFAMGNHLHNDCRGSHPDIASLPEVIAVSSSDSESKKISESGYGECLAILAPSSSGHIGGIVTTDRVGTKGFNTGIQSYELKDLDYSNGFYGTSAAAPQIAATLGLGYSINRNINARTLEQHLLDTASKVHPEAASYDSTTGRSLTYGFGQLDIAAFIEKI